MSAVKHVVVVVVTQACHLYPESNAHSRTR